MLLLVLVGAAVWLALRVAEGLWLPSRVQLTVHAPAPDRYQVYFDTGAGFNEAQSRKSDLPQRKDPVGLEFWLPAEPVRALRLDPGTRPGERWISAVCWHGFMRSRCVRGEALVRSLHAGQQVHVGVAPAGGALLGVAGADPQLYFEPAQGGVSAMQVTVARVRMTDVALLAAILVVVALAAVAARRAAGRAGMWAWLGTAALAGFAWFFVRGGGAHLAGPGRALDLAFMGLLSVALVLVLGAWLHRPRLDQLPAPPAAGALALLTAAVAVLFGWQLELLWSQQAVQYYALGGLLPWSDAGNYLDGALSIVQRGELTAWGCRRPIQHVLLAGLLGLTGANLGSVVVLQTAAAVLATAAAGAAVWRRLGAGAALVFCAVLFALAREQFIGTVLSENAGFVFGVLGFALILFYGGGPAPAAGRALFGLFVLTLGLCARAGAFVLLPLLVCLLAAQADAGRRMRRAILAATVVAAGFGFNSALNAAWCPAGGAAFSNFAPVLYGLTRGELDWGRLDTDHPELSGLTEREAARRAYAFAWQEFRSSPGRFAGALVDGARAYVTNNMAVTRAGLVPWEWFAVACGLLAGLAMTPARSPPVRYLGGLVLVAAAGLLLSAPFIVLGGPRAFTPSIAFYALLPALGVAWPLARRHGAALEAAPAAGAAGAWALGLAMLAVGLLAGGGVLASLARLHATQAAPVCADGVPARPLRGVGGAVIHLFAQRRGDYAVADMHIETLGGLLAREINEDRAVLERIDPPATLAIAYDVDAQALRRLVVPGAHVDLPAGGITWMCLSQRYRGSAYHWLAVPPR